MPLSLFKMWKIREGIKVKNLIIACQTIEDEVNKAMAQTGSQDPILWVDSEYHIDPSKLRAKLQETINEVEGYDQLLFAYGCCGNGLVGLEATTARLIIPKTDDCISLVLSVPNEKFQRRKKTYFLTRGWMESCKSIFSEYQYTINKYGPKRAERLFNLMLKNYEDLMLIDTGAYPLDRCQEKAKDFASSINLNFITEKGSTWFLEKLLIGPYDQDFCVIEKGQTVTLNHFGYEDYGILDSGQRNQIP